MNRYELLYIIPTTFTDEEVGAIEAKVQGLLAKYQATVESTRRLGKLRLTYPINHQRHGHYVLVMFQAEAPMIIKLDEAIRITQEVLRHLILRAEDKAEEQKFELVQFAEVTVESKEERNRRRERGEVREPSKEEDNKPTAAVEAAAPAATAEAKTASVPGISADELDKKIDQALTSDAAAA